MNILHTPPLAHACGVGHWVGLLCILTMHLMDEILGIALIKAIDWYVDGNH